MSNVSYNEDFNAWVIDLNSPEGHGFAGVYMFGHEMTAHQAALPKVKDFHKKATVRRAYVVINAV